MLWLFLRQKIFMVRNSFTPGGLIRRLPFIALGTGLWLLLYFGTYKIISFLRGTGTAGAILSERLLSLFLLCISAFLLLSTIITSLSSFYLSKDIPFLLAKPIEIRDIIRIKSLESLLLSTWMAALFSIPVFVAYGVSYQAPAAYYAAGLAAFLLLILIAAGMGMTAAHLLTKFFPAKRSRGVLFVLGVLLFLFLYFLIKSGLPEAYTSPTDFLKTFSVFGADSPLLPGSWVMRTILPAMKGLRPDLLYMALLLGGCALFFFTARVSGERFYYSNVEKAGPSVYGRSPLPDGAYPGPETALFFKDVRGFFRDAGQWTQTLIIGALAAVYIYNFESMPLRAITALYPSAKELLVLVNLFMAGLVLTAMAARFLFTSVSLEGRSFWVVRSAPLSLKRFLWSKFLHGVIPLSAIVMSLVWAADYVLKAGGTLLLLSEGTSLLLSLSVCGLGTGLGAAFPRFEYENIASVAMGMGAIAFMLLAFGLVTVTLSAGAWGYYIYGEKIAAAGLHSPEYLRPALCLFLILLINGAAFYLPMRAGIRRLQTMQS